MSFPASTKFGPTTFPKGIVTVLLATCLLILAGCGSTKVYNSNKTISFRDSVYNVTEVKVYSSKTEAVISDDESVDLRGADKKRINALLEQHSSLYVRQTLSLDDLVIVYQAKSIDSWSDFNKMNKQFASANKKLKKFLADPKKMQLELR
jgi:hypothetical protein